MDDIDPSLECSVFGTTGRSSPSCISGDEYWEPLNLPIRYVLIYGASALLSSHTAGLLALSAMQIMSFRETETMCQDNEKSNVVIDTGTSKGLDNENRRRGEGVVFKWKRPRKSCHAALTREGVSQAQARLYGIQGHGRNLETVG